MVKRNQSSRAINRLAIFRARLHPLLSGKERLPELPIQASVKVNFASSPLRLPKLGAVRAAYPPHLRGAVKTVTVSRSATAKYYACVLVETGITLLSLQLISANTSVGIDVAQYWREDCRPALSAERFEEAAAVIPAAWPETKGQ